MHVSCKLCDSSIAINNPTILSSDILVLWTKSQLGLWLLQYTVSSWTCANTTNSE